jgi:hypothetical protein
MAYCVVCEDDTLICACPDVCGAVVDVSDGPYGEPIPWQYCDKPPGHTGSCDQLVPDTNKDGVYATPERL